jgi:hypothetical protein
MIPVGGSFGQDPTSRPAVALVTAAGLIVRFEVLDRPSGEPDPMAEELAAVLDLAAERAGGWPGVVRVRWPEVAGALRRRFAARGAPGGPKLEVGRLPEIDQVGVALLLGLGARPSAVEAGIYACSPDTWAAWDLPPELVVRIFAAAAAFLRAEPWKVHANVDVLEARVPDGRTWTACILGQGGREYGLGLYADADDFWRTVGPVGRPGERFGEINGPVVTLLLDPGDEVPKALRLEVTAAGWELADPRVYPHVVTLNTPAGGLLRDHAEDLAAILEAVPRFVAAHPGAVEAARPVEGWRDRKTGVRLSYYAEVRRLTQLTHELAEGLLFGVGVLAPGGAEGPGAEPEAGLDPPFEVAAAADAFVDAELALVERFADHLFDRARLADSTVRRHALNAQMFVEFLAAHQGAPVRAVHEYDLRSFLFDAFHREFAASEAQSRAMPASLERFFEYLAAEEGIVCPWAAAVLADRKVYGERRLSYPGGSDWDDDVMDWRSEHDEDLFARLLLPSAPLGEDGDWGGTMGPTQARLQHEMHRRWLLWRDEEIRSGHADPKELCGVLEARQRAWTTSPHPDLGGKSPKQAVRAERRERRRTRKRS